VKLNGKIVLLKQQIENAFIDLKYPGDNNIVWISEYDPEKIEIKEDFKNKHWKDLTLEFLWPKQSQSLGFFTPQAYRFYLPGYMIVSVEFYDDSDVIPEYVIDSLTPFTESDEKEISEALTYGLEEVITEVPELKEIAESTKSFINWEHDYEQIQKDFLTRVEVFTSRQKKSIVSFLEFMKSEHGQDFFKDAPGKALRRYWNKFK
jgi:hypothetical protein